MLSKKLLLLTLLFSATVALIATAAGRHWWKTQKTTGPTVSGQPSIAAEYGKLMSRYREFDSVADLSGTIRIYDGEKNNHLKETRTFRYYRFRNEFYWQLSYLKTFCDGRLVVQLDTMDRVITVSMAAVPGRPGQTAGNMPPALPFNDTTAFGLSGSVAQEGGNRVLSLHSDRYPGIKECRLFYDPAHYRLSRAEIEWWKGGRQQGARNIWLGKLDYDQRPAGRPDISGEISSIITVCDGQVSGIGRFREYKINANL